MSLEVIGAGFGRTGTLSLKVALEQLGYDRTHHMEEVLRSGKQIDLWHSIALGEAPAWDAIFDGYRASVDFPSSTYYAELLEHYPDAKVVLTTRDVDSWYRSASTTIYQARELAPAWAIRSIPRVRKMFELTEATVWQRVFDGRFSDEQHAKSVFSDYLAEVKHNVAPDRLLVFEVSEGWAPLCAFLGCDVPDRPFPHENDTKSFRRKLGGLRVLAAAPYIVVAAAILGVLLAR